tara:strand:- start:1405 stop:1686 length:282 start_codon:yes stop_codon:yes gene_type:complete
MGRSRHTRIDERTIVRGADATARSEERARAHRAYDRNFKSSGFVMGPAAVAMYQAGGDKLMIWLAKNTPEGGTILETLCAIAVDAMHEEGEKQ